MRASSVGLFQASGRSVTLIGMSGVGKTTLARKLPSEEWFHFSGDYRIGTRYLIEEIQDQAKTEAMKVPYLRQLLRNDTLFLGVNLSIDNLAPLSLYLGKIGNPELGGLPLEEFIRRQRLHHDAEVAALLDMPSFKHRAQALYGYPHFIADAGGSLCELDNPQVIETLARESVVVYIRASQSEEQELIERAERYPKPLYYPEPFLRAKLAKYLRLQQLNYVAQVDPDDFVRWVFSELFRARLPKYEAIAQRYGVSVSTADVAAVRDAKDFVALIESAIARARKGER